MEQIQSQKLPFTKTKIMLNLARKYRPQTFDDLIGQDSTNLILNWQLKNNKLASAYLFSGMRGTGKTSTARILAKAANCEIGSPCNKCDSCISITKGINLDVIEIDAASHTGVENIKEIIQQTYHSAMGKYKIFIIDEVHMLSKSAFNALLKILEEPPSHVIFILATTEIDKVPETIFSRCQQYTFKPILVGKILEQLVKIADAEDIKIEKEACLEIAKAAHGSMRDGLSILNTVCGLGDEITVSMISDSLGLTPSSALLEIIDYIKYRNYSGILNSIEKLYSSGADLRMLPKHLLSYFRALLLMDSGIDDQEILELSTFEIFSLRKVYMTQSYVIETIEQLITIDNHMKDTYNPRILLETGLLKL